MAFKVIDWWGVCRHLFKAEEVPETSPFQQSIDYKNYHDLITMANLVDLLNSVCKWLELHKSLGLICRAGNSNRITD